MILQMIEVGDNDLQLDTPISILYGTSDTCDKETSTDLEESLPLKERKQRGLTNRGADP